MSEPKSITIAKRYSGFQEHDGPNAGPQLTNMRRDLNLPATPAPWCAAFVAWCLVQAYTLQMATNRRSEVRKALGFASPWYCDACKDWYLQAIQADRITDAPTAGDVFILLDRNGHPHHTGFVTTAPAGGYFGTIEGNTNEGGSPEGTGVHARIRPVTEYVKFIALPPALKV